MNSVLAFALLTLGIQSPAPEAALVADAERLAKLGNNEEARVRVERAIEALFVARPDPVDAQDERVFRDAGALAYKLRSLEPAIRAWDAVRRFRAKTLAADSLELQNARGNVSWLGEQLGRLTEARAHEEAMVAAIEGSQAADHDALMLARANLGDTLLQLGEPDGALEQFRKVVEVRRAKFDAKHPQRLRAELDLACGLAGVDDLAGADAVLVEVLANAPTDPFAIRVRAASDLALVRAARGEVASFHGAVAGLAREIETARKSIEVLSWREAEIRAAELRPFADLLVSAANGFGVLAGLDETLESVGRLAAVLPRGEPHAVFRRIERSRITGKGRDRKLETEDCLVAIVFTADGRARWVDLGSLTGTRALVDAWSNAARAGTGAEEAKRITEALFHPLAVALGEPAVLRVVPDDVVWAAPLHALDLRTKDGRAIPIEAILRGTPSEVAVSSTKWRVLGDPAPKIAGERAAVVSGSGAAASFVAKATNAPLGGAAAWGTRLGLAPDVGEACTIQRITSVDPAANALILALPMWSAPASTPCLTTPRAIAASSPLAGAMVREDVVGGSSPADLCGLLFAGFAEPAGEDGRVPGAPRAADLRALEGLRGKSVLLVAQPARRPAVEVARDVEATTRALIAAGCADVCVAVGAIPTSTVTLPSDLEERLPTGNGKSAPTPAGPWIRTRAVR